MPTPALGTCQFFYSEKELIILRVNSLLAIYSLSFCSFTSFLNPLKHCRFHLTVHHFEVHRVSGATYNDQFSDHLFYFFFFWRFLSMVFKTVNIFEIIRTWGLSFLSFFIDIVLFFFVSFSNQDQSLHYVMKIKKVRQLCINCLLKLYLYITTWTCFIHQPFCGQE